MKEHHRCKQQRRKMRTSSNNVSEINWVTFKEALRCVLWRRKSWYFERPSVDVSGSRKEFLESHAKICDREKSKKTIHNEGLLGHCIVLLLGVCIRHHTRKAWQRQSITSTTTNKCKSIPQKCHLKEFDNETNFQNEVSSFEVDMEGG